MRKWASINARNVSAKEEKKDKEIHKKSKLNMRNNVIDSDEVDV
jgi:hypothetical protein